MKQQIEKENYSEEENAYQTMIINHVEKINVNFNTSQLEQWSILSK